MTAPLLPGQTRPLLFAHRGYSSRAPENTLAAFRAARDLEVPGIELDDEGVCSACREFEHVEPRTRTWFKTPADLDARRDAARARAGGDFDCLHLLSGGKDSTYALYQLVERGWRVHALTLDNGYISDGAKANIARYAGQLREQGFGELRAGGG